MNKMNKMNKPVFVQVSGGRTSGYMAYLLKDKPDHYFLFQNTGRERKETYDFLHKMETEWGLPLIWLEYSCPDPTKKARFNIVDYKTSNRTGVPFAQLIIKRKAIPNKFKRFCTMELKANTGQRYARSIGILKRYNAVGFRADENRTPRSTKMIEGIAPLQEMGVTIKDVQGFWGKQSFDLDLPYMPNGKTFGGNCMGCFWHSEYQHAHLAHSNPKEYDWLIEQEEKMGYTFNENYSFKELQKHISRKTWDLLSQTDGLCQSTSGGCGT